MLAMIKGREKSWFGEAAAALAFAGAAVADRAGGRCVDGHGSGRCDPVRVAVHDYDAGRARGRVARERRRRSRRGSGNSARSAHTVGGIHPRDGRSGDDGMARLVSADCGSTRVAYGGDRRCQTASSHTASVAWLESRRRVHSYDSDCHRHRVMTLLTSRSHKTELATATQTFYHHRRPNERDLAALRRRLAASGRRLAESRHPIGSSRAGNPGSSSSLVSLRNGRCG